MRRAETILGVTLAGETWTVPATTGEGNDRRCLSFAIRGVPLLELELYDLDADPSASTDLSTDRASLAKDLVRRLESYRFQQVSDAEVGEIDPELEARLKALGYLR